MANCSIKREYNIAFRIYCDITQPDGTIRTTYRQALCEDLEDALILKEKDTNESRERYRQYQQRLQNATQKNKPTKVREEYNYKQLSTDNLECRYYIVVVD